MGLKKFKPTTPALRYKTVSDFADITKSEPEKSLLRPLKKTEVDKLMDRYVVPHRRRKAKRAGKPVDPR